MQYSLAPMLIKPLIQLILVSEYESQVYQIRVGVKLQGGRPLLSSNGQPAFVSSSYLDVGHLQDVWH